MENSFFILGKDGYEIKRLHICTWDFKNSNSLIELGFEIKNTNIKHKNIDLTFAASFLNKVTKDDVFCLAGNFSDKNNCRFIFNDNIEANSIDKDDRNGICLEFENRIKGAEKEKLYVLPIQKSVTCDNSCLTISVDSSKGDNIYFRLLIKTKCKTLAVTKKGISKSAYIYDIKVNESRNTPDYIFDHKATNKLKFCDIEQCFCFHILPNTFEISFIDDDKLKSVRMLEFDSFKRYLGNHVKNLKDEEYMIIFNKWKMKEGEDKHITFFSIFNKEIIGLNQLAIAITLNIICSFLFALKDEINFNFYGFSIVYWISLFLILVTILYQTRNWILYRIKKIIKR